MNGSRQPVILITGANGQVGFALTRSLQGLGELVALNRNGLDLADARRIRTVVREVRPALIVNAAAYTAVDRAESEPDLAQLINGVAPGVLAEEAARLGAPLIHYSTDYVFDGTSDEPYRETDPTNPQNVYGRTKLAGEQAIEAVGGAFLVLRTSWVYGTHGKNFLLTMLRLAGERKELRVVADQIGAPTWNYTIAALTAHIVAQGQAAVSGAPEWWATRSGVYHLTAGGSTSWHGFASAIIRRACAANAPDVLPISTGEYPLPARRPTNSRMSNEKLEAVFGLRSPGWEAALELCLAGFNVAGRQ
jgi:dTDP-4-dehydrorhamnose reductase